ncbi:MAG: OmpH family outer membrane protein [Flavobacteriaceae bacterium]|nr:OmpH family outer membrane protein [Flavobacteriaceae bacterium]
MGNTFYHWSTVLRKKHVRVSYSLLIVFFAASSLSAQKNVRIGFLNLDKVLESHKGYAASSQELEGKIAEWRNEITERQKSLDERSKALELERPLLTEEIIEERSEDITFDQEKLDQYIEQRFGTEGDWIKQKVLLAQPAQDEILTAIREVADDRKLDYVFDSTADIVILHSEKKYDISDLVIRYITIEDKKKAKEFLLKTKKEERQNSSNPQLESRRKALEKRKAERLRLLEERKVEIELKKKEREEELARRKKEQAEALEKRKQERKEELERRKKELEEKRKQTK